MIFRETKIKYNPYNQREMSYILIFTHLEILIFHGSIRYSWEPCVSFKTIRSSINAHVGMKNESCISEQTEDTKLS